MYRNIRCYAILKYSGKKKIDDNNNNNIKGTFTF